MDFITHGFWYCVIGVAWDSGLIESMRTRYMGHGESHPGNKISDISAEISAKYRKSVEIEKISPPKFPLSDFSLFFPIISR